MAGYEWTRSTIPKILILLDILFHIKIFSINFKLLIIFLNAKKLNLCSNPNKMC
jgi:hypothetical protein